MIIVLTVGVVLMMIMLVSLFMSVSVALLVDILMLTVVLIPAGVFALSGALVLTGARAGAGRWIVCSDRCLTSAAGQCISWLRLCCRSTLCWSSVLCYLLVLSPLRWWWCNRHRRKSYSPAKCRCCRCTRSLSLCRERLRGF